MDDSDGAGLRPTFVKQVPVAERTIAEVGSANKADVDGSSMVVKTRTAEKVMGSRPSNEGGLTMFTGAAPTDDSRYLFTRTLDEPEPLPKTFGFLASGWSAVPVAGHIVSRVFPILVVEPQWEQPIEPFPQMLSAGGLGGRGAARPQSPFACGARRSEGPERGDASRQARRSGIR